MNRRVLVTLSVVTLFFLACISTNALPGAEHVYMPTAASPLPYQHTGPTQTCTVSAEHLNLRSQAGTSAAVLTVLDAGTIVTIVSEPPQDNWIHVNVTGFDGWINSTYCKGERNE